MAFTRGWRSAINHFDIQGDQSEDTFCLCKLNAACGYPEILHYQPHSPSSTKRRRGRDN